MFAGHVGAGLALASVERRVNAGAFVGAALLLDLVLWPLVLLGWETVSVPQDFAASHQLHFVFPYSHGLFAALAWSALAAALAWLGLRRLTSAARSRAALAVAAAVFSHWLLDALVHRPQLPLAGAGSPAVGLGLWDRMELALWIEAAIAVGGLGWFVAGSGWARRRAVALVALGLLVLAFTVVGMTLAPPPPSAQALALSSWLTLIVVTALVWWAGRAGR